MEAVALALFRIKFIEDLVIKLLNFLVSIFGNYGIAIIFTTIIVKLLLYPLMVKQERSMYTMKLLKPELDKVKEKYKGDKQKIEQETMKVYKDNKVNPAGGCLPVLIQMPIFIALYYTFTSKAIPSDAKFLWFNLTEPDRLYQIGKFSINLLPILSAVLMFVQQKLSVPKKDANEEKGPEDTMQSAMMAMPIMLLALFYSFPSGVNLYYVFNSLISIIQQKYIQNKIKKELEKNE